ncbi:DHS-like NAD/FAD-binding domain-containing protein [Trametes sanguinea]|nr:DHS-like NAD/FAD-binding domain-containing protein [Trametes sanguinea]
MDDSDELLMLYDGPTKVLETRDIPGVAKYMKSESAGAGIPDFRYPKKGQDYHRSNGSSTLTAKLNLPYPRALFELSYFKFNPIPLYTLARELYPGRYRPTLTHSFIHLLAERGSLDTCYTENIDALERQAGVPADHLVEPHGSLATQCCVNCQAPYDREKMKAAVEKCEPAHCESCDGLVKPGVELHGELPQQRFTEKWQELQNADLLFVIGTSLTIPPFAPLATLVPQDCPRVLIHMDFAGDIGMRSDDVLLLGKCDDIVRDLCKELGWEDALMQEWAKTEGESAPSVALQIDEEVGDDVDGARSITAFDGSPPGETMGPDDTNEFGVLADAEWQEKEPKADSLTERLRTALEHSEKPSAYVPDPGITFVARSLSGEELFADTAVDHPSRPGDVPVVEGSSVLVG